METWPFLTVFGALGSVFKPHQSLLHKGNRKTRQKGAEMYEDGLDPVHSSIRSL